MISPELQSAADAIIAALPDAVMTEDLAERLKVIAKRHEANLQETRLKAMLCAGICIEDALKGDPDVDRQCLLRLIAGEFIRVAAFFVRSLKRRSGEELSPGRFALAAYGMAESLAKEPWSDEIAQDITGDNGSLRALIKEEARRRGADATDDELRALWKAYGGKFYGPNVETGDMEEAKLLPFLRMLGASKDDMP